MAKVEMLSETGIPRRTVVTVEEVRSKEQVFLLVNRRETYNEDQVDSTFIRVTRLIVRVSQRTLSRRA